MTKFLESGKMARSFGISTIGFNEVPAKDIVCEEPND